MTQQTALPLVRGAKVWRRPLTELLDALSRELEHRPCGMWAWRALAREAVVAVCRDSAHRRTLRIARQTRPATPAELAAWGREVEAMRQALGCAGWRSVPAESCAGIEARWVEVFFIEGV